MFFFHDTATTEIYTYWHTLSLHDALPFFCVKDAAVVARGGAQPLQHGHAVLRPGRDRPGALHVGPAVGQRTDQRSEEHTSELQSLMRTSYAVFCLKKKKPIWRIRLQQRDAQQTHTTHV